MSVTKDDETYEMTFSTEIKEAFFSAIFSHIHFPTFIRARRSRRKLNRETGALRTDSKPTVLSDDSRVPHMREQWLLSVARFLNFADFKKKDFEYSRCVQYVRSSHIRISLSLSLFPFRTDR